MCRQCGSGDPQGLGDGGDATEAVRVLRKWHTDREAGTLTPRSDMTMGQLMDGRLATHRGEDTTREGYEPKIRLHIKPRIGKVKVVRGRTSDWTGVPALGEHAHQGEREQAARPQELPAWLVTPQPEKQKDPTRSGVSVGVRGGT